jgi:K+-sensing histidine kinase KdpD
LGLAIVRGVVERLGGTLSIEGVRSLGTTVTIHVPQPTIDGRDPIRLDPAAIVPPLTLL